MTPAAIDTALLILQNAERYLRFSRHPVPTPADITAVAILEQAARDVLGVRSTQ